MNWKLYGRIGNYMESQIVGQDPWQPDFNALFYTVWFFFKTWNNSWVSGLKTFFTEKN